MSTRAAKRRGVAEELDEGGWIVRGTLDPVTALGFVVGESDTVDMMVRYDHADADELAEWCYRMLDRAHPGVWRKIHCLPGSYGEHVGWAWEVRQAAPGRGAFRGVMFAP